MFSKKLGYFRIFFHFCSNCQQAIEDCQLRLGVLFRERVRQTSPFLITSTLSMMNACTASMFLQNIDHLKKSETGAIMRQED